MAKNLKVGMLVCASLLAANAAYAENSATQEGMRFEQQTSKIKGQWKFSGDKHKSLQVDTERTFHQRYPLVML